MNSPESDKCCSGRTLAIIVAILGACLIFVALVWITKKYTLPSTAVDEARKVERAKARAELTAAEAVALKEVGWINADKGIVRLPIAEAMKLAEREWRHPAEARAKLIARVVEATAPPPKPPEEPSPFE